MILQTHDGRRTPVAASALIGADGGRGQVRSHLGIKMSKTQGSHHLINIFVRADLKKSVDLSNADLNGTTGIADAHNLAEKLAASRVGDADPELLESCDASLSGGSSTALTALPDDGVILVRPDGFGAARSDAISLPA